MSISRLKNVWILYNKFESGSTCFKPVFIKLFYSPQRRNPHLQSVVTGIKLGDVSSVSRLLCSGLVPVSSTHKGASLLCLAVSSASPDMVIMMIVTEMMMMMMMMMMAGGGCAGGRGRRQHTIQLAGGLNILQRL